MIRALYTAARGMSVQAINQDVIANNIANAQTPGYKRLRLVEKSFADSLDSQIASLQEKNKPYYPDSDVQAVLVQAEQATDSSQGTLKDTGNQLDFAIDGPGSFEVQGKNGTRLTRAGNFQINSNSELCTSEGDLVMGQNGAIKLPEKDWDVSEDGSIVSEGNVVNRLKLVGSSEEETRIHHKQLESANLNVVQEMVQMITNLRSFEANQKVIQNVDKTLEKLINEGGRV